MGLAIVVPDVDWKSAALKKVTFESDKPVEPAYDINDLYQKYLVNSARSETPELLNFMNELNTAGFTPKHTRLYYLAHSQKSEVKYIMWNVFADKLTPLGDYGSTQAIVDKDGVRSNPNMGNIYFCLPEPGYTIGTGFYCGWIITKESGAYGPEWGRYGQYEFRFAPTAINKDNLITADWNYPGAAIWYDEDTSPRKGVYVMGASQSGPFYYKHNDIPMVSKMCRFVPGASFSPVLCGFRP